MSEDPTGAEFPWKPPSVFDALGDEFLSGTEGETESLDDIKGRAKVIGLYFSECMLVAYECMLIASLIR